MSSNPNRQRLLSPIDYLALLAGAQPPSQMEPEIIPPAYDVPFRVVPPQGGLPMPFADQPMPMFNPMAPAIPQEVQEARRRWGY